MATDLHDLFWNQSNRMFDQWIQEVDRDPARLIEILTLYRRWIVRLDGPSPDAILVRDVLLEMLAEMMVEAALSLRARGG